MLNVFTNQISKLNTIAAEQVHDVETCCHNFGEAGNVVLCAVVYTNLPDLVLVCQVSVVPSEQDLLVVSNCNRGTGESVLGDCLVN